MRNLASCEIIHPNVIEKHNEIKRGSLQIKTTTLPKALSFRL